MAEARKLADADVSIARYDCRMLSTRRKLIATGHSFALVVDRQVCRLLRLNRDTKFRMHLEGDRIVFEPIRPASPPPRLDHIRLHRLMVALNVKGLSPAHFQRLSHDGVRYGVFFGLISINDDTLDRVTIKRLERCLARRREVRESWDDTIDAVLAEIPCEIPSGIPSGKQDE